MPRRPLRLLDRWDRWRLLLSAIAAAAACAGVALVACVADEVALPARPNILLIVMDDMGLELGAYGDARAATPAIDALAREGLRFDRAYVAASSCSPSRAALLSGLYPHQNGQWGFPNDARLHPGIATLPAYLNDAGYFTGLVGKLHVAAAEHQIPFDFRQETRGSQPETAAALAASVTEFLAAAGPRPFFLMVSTHAPHFPYPGFEDVPPLPDARGTDELAIPASALDTPRFRALLAGLYDAYAFADGLVASALGALAAAGLEGSTLVLLTSDHGPALPAAKATLFEAGIRVPLLARWPGVIAPGRTSSALVSSVDLLPTLLALAGVPADAPLPGRSFVGLLSGTGARGDDAVYAGNSFMRGRLYFPQRAIVTRRFKYVRTLRPDIEFRNGSIQRWSLGMLQLWHTLPRARFLLERIVRQPREALYDLERDPDELRNLAGSADHAGRLRELRGRLRRFMQETGDPWLALWDGPGDRPDPFQPTATRDGPFEPLWLDEQIALVQRAMQPTP